MWSLNDSWNSYNIIMKNLKFMRYFSFLNNENEIFSFYIKLTKIKDHN